MEIRTSLLLRIGLASWRVSVPFPARAQIYLLEKVKKKTPIGATQAGFREG